MNQEDKKHILIVDDDDRIRELIKEYLQNNNFYTTTAKDAFDAKKKMGLLKFDLIILYIMMPGTKWTRSYKRVKK